MLKSALEAVEAGVEAAKSAGDMTRLKSAVDDGADAVRRAMKHSRYAAEDLVEEAAHEVRRHPLATVAVTFGVAFGTGFLLGWVASLSRKS